jgi:hypothetical protein
MYLSFLPKHGCSNPLLLQRRARSCTFANSFAFCHLQMPPCIAVQPPSWASSAHQSKKPRAALLGFTADRFPTARMLCTKPQPELLLGEAVSSLSLPNSPRAPPAPPASKNHLHRHGPQGQEAAAEGGGEARCQRQGRQEGGGPQGGQETEGRQEGQEVIARLDLPAQRALLQHNDDIKYYSA